MLMEKILHVDISANANTFMVFHCSVHSHHYKIGTSMNQCVKGFEDFGSFVGTQFFATVIILSF